MGSIFLPESHQASPVKTPHTALPTATVIFNMPRNEVALWKENEYIDHWSHQ